MSKHHARIFFVLISQITLVVDVQALPSFARQTGEACTACHVQTWGADLLPRGREFKLRGYTDGGASSWMPPVSATIDGTVTTPVDPNRGLIGGDLSSTSANSGYKASLFYAGRIVDRIGSLFSLSYQNLNDRVDSYYLDKLDLRFANQVDVWGTKMDYGISVNNQPGLSDLWNTMPAWSFTRAASPVSTLVLSPLFTHYDHRGWETVTPTAVNRLEPPRGFRNAYPNLIDGLLAGNTGGASLYGMIGDWVYLEAGAYSSLPRDVQKGVGRSTIDRYYVYNYLYENSQPQLDGGAPYWRFALQHNFGGHYVSVGHFGLVAETYQHYRSFFPNVGGYGQRDIVSDIALDATYQYSVNPDHIVELKGLYVRESARYRSDVTIGAKTFVRPWESLPTRETVRINAAYTWAQTVGVAFGYTRYMTGPYRNLYGSGYQLPDREGYIAELSYTPFGKSTSLAGSLLNLRLNLTYMGDLHGRRTADTLYLNGGLAF